MMSDGTVRVLSSIYDFKLKGNTTKISDEDEVGLKGPKSFDVLYGCPLFFLSFNSRIFIAD